MEAMEALIALNHPPEAVRKYTPRNSEAWLFVARKRREGELKELLAVFRLATQGDKNSIDKVLKAEE